MDFMSTFKSFWMDFYSLLFFNLEFPQPIGSIKPITLLAFYVVANVMADFISNVSSRRD